MSKICLWITRHWPFNSIGLMFPIYLWLVGKGGTALMREIYGTCVKTGIGEIRDEQHEI